MAGNPHGPSLGNICILKIEIIQSTYGKNKWLWNLLNLGATQNFFYPNQQITVCDTKQFLLHYFQFAFFPIKVK